jgi:hypothetical protein
LLNGVSIFGYNIPAKNNGKPRIANTDVKKVSSAW